MTHQNLFNFFHLNINISSLCYLYSVEPNRINQITVSSPNPPMSEYNAHQVVTLSCNGEVGNPAKDLRWCYRDGGKNPPGNFQGWQNDNDIVKGSFISFGCQKTQTSTLRYNVSAEYPYKEIKCETAYGVLPCGHSSIISSNITIYRCELLIFKFILCSIFRKY